MPATETTTSTPWSFMHFENAAIATSGSTDAVGAPEPVGTGVGDARLTTPSLAAGPAAHAANVMLSARRARARGTAARVGRATVMAVDSVDAAGLAGTAASPSCRAGPSRPAQSRFQKPLMFGR